MSLQPGKVKTNILVNFNELKKFKKIKWNGISNVQIFLKIWRLKIAVIYFLEVYVYTLSILLKVMHYSYVMISFKNEYVQSHQNIYLNKNNFNTKWN